MMPTDSCRYVKTAIRLAPQNPSPWNYFRGILRMAKRPASSEKEFVEEFASLERPNEIRSSHALDMLSDILVTQEQGVEQARKALDLLATTYDPIRANYWEYRKSQLQPVSETTASA